MQTTTHLTATSPLSKWLSYIEQTHSKSIDLGLKRVKSVAKQLDVLNPAPFVITVAGTNGKGTTCRLLELILMNAGYSVGVYSSPHLIRYNERIRIQGRELPDECHSATFATIEQQKKETSLTYFEYSTIAALSLFKQANLDIVILEVGLGGRLDATNIVDADIAVITSIDVDHVDFLGSDRNHIAFEKSGIFRANKLAVIGEPDRLSAFYRQAEALPCPLIQFAQDWQYRITQDTWQWQGKNLCHQDVLFEDLPLCHIPLHNAATALAVIAHLPFHIQLSHIKQALCEVTLPGRFQSIDSQQLANLEKTVGKSYTLFPQVILDVGHNPHAAKYLATQLAKIKPKICGRIIAICGVLQDKDTQGVLQALLSVIDIWYCAGLPPPRGQTGQVLQQKLLNLDHKAQSCAFDHVNNACIQALADFNKEDYLLVFGSFYTVAEFLMLIESK